LPNRDRERQKEVCEPSEIDTEYYLWRLTELAETLRSATETGRDAAGVVTLDQSRVGRLSRMDALQTQAMAQASHRQREVALRRVLAALRRIEAGEFGYCVACGEAIDPRRLEVDPAAPRCVRCAEAAEKT